MKILKREQFLKTPKGTVYSYYEPCIFTELNVKTTDSSDYENDFVFLGLIGQFNLDNGAEYSNICERLEQGESIPASFEETQREGLFDDKQLFLVYEKEDIKNMISVLTEITS